jgi:hypothetical protein
MVMVDAEHHGLASAGGGPQIDGRLPAVAPDLEQRPDLGAAETCLMQRPTLVVGHETLRRTRDREQMVVERLQMNGSSR